jgi:hypothetical protein
VLLAFGPLGVLAGMGCPTFLVQAAATRRVEKPVLDVTQRFVRGMEQTSQIIALALVFFFQGDLRVLAWRIDEARNAFERLFRGSFRSVKWWMAEAICAVLTFSRLLLTHTRVNFGLENAAIPRLP